MSRYDDPMPILPVPSADQSARPMPMTPCSRLLRSRPLAQLLCMEVRTPDTARFLLTMQPEPLLICKTSQLPAAVTTARIAR
jgi:hypothetical protein